MESKLNLPDVYFVNLQLHPCLWTNGHGEPPDTYRFKVIGKRLGSKWQVHAVYADRPAPPQVNPRGTTKIRGLIRASLSEQTGMPVSAWNQDLLAWEGE